MKNWIRVKWTSLILKQACPVCEGDVGVHASLQQIAIMVQNTNYVQESQHSKTVNPFPEAMIVFFNVSALFGLLVVLSTFKGPFSVNQLPVQVLYIIKSDFSLDSTGQKHPA